MIRAIRSINTKKTVSARPTDRPVVVDLHPSRPEYRGIMAHMLISLEADPTFEEIEAAGEVVAKNAEPHTVLDDMFLISGMIPRVTPYEVGLLRGIRFNSSIKSWEKDEVIADERLLMCNLKGRRLPQCPQSLSILTIFWNREGGRGIHGVQSCWRCQYLEACDRVSRRFRPFVRRARRLPPGRPIQ